MPWILAASCLFLWPSTNNRALPLLSVVQTPCRHVLERAVLRSACPAPLSSAFGCWAWFVFPPASTILGRAGNTSLPGGPALARSEASSRELE